MSPGRPVNAARVIAAVEDLFFGARIQETARQLAVPLTLVGSAEEAAALARTAAPALLIVDLNARTGQPLEAVRTLKADPAVRGVTVLGFCSHVQHELRTAADEAGCDQVLARSAFTAQLPELLRPYGEAKGVA
jgi:CheY-like chemotaxis protein